MENELHYLVNVLGLRSVVLPESPALGTVVGAPSEEPKGPETFQVLFLADRPFEPKAQELFEKMRQAMKLEEASTQLIFASEKSDPEIQVLAFAAQRVVCFSQELFARVQKELEFKFLSPPPGDLLRKPELKKQSWETLKQVMKSLEIL